MDKLAGLIKPTVESLKAPTIAALKLNAHIDAWCMGIFAIIAFLLLIACIIAGIATSIEEGDWVYLFAAIFGFSLLIIILVIMTLFIDSALSAWLNPIYYSISSLVGIN